MCSYYWQSLFAQSTCVCPTNRRTSELTFPGDPSAFLRQISTGSYGSDRDPPVLTTMGNLCLCAASARPPGLSPSVRGHGMLTNDGTSSQRQCLPTQSTHDLTNYLPTTYYKTYVTPSLPILSSPTSSLHVISALTTMTDTSCAPSLPPFQFSSTTSSQHAPSAPTTLTALSHATSLPHL